MENRPIEILIVEDDPTDLMITREALAHAKVLNNLHAVEDGVKAMEFLHRQGEYAKAPRPDLVLLDLNLPRKSGQEVLAEIRAEEAFKDLAIVILTTSKAETDLWKTYGLPANSYTTKPLDFEAFAEIVRAVRNLWFTMVSLPGS